MNWFRSLAFTAMTALLSLQLAQAQHVSKVDGRLPEMRNLGGHTARLTTVSAAHGTAYMFQSGSSFARIEATPRGRLERIYTIGKIAGATGAAQAKHLQGMLSRLHPLSTVGFDVPGGNVERIMTPNGLTLRVDFWARLLSGEVNFEKERTLDKGELARIPLPNGWVFCFLGPNRYALIDPVAQAGVVVWGDPHFNKYERGVEGAHVGDFTASTMTFVIEGENGPMLCVAKSTGGDAKNGFGLPTTFLAMNGSTFLFVEGLNTDKPKGVSGEGGLFAYEGFRSDVESGNVVYWVPKSSEFRTVQGDRPAPPPTAQVYERAEPALKLPPVEIAKSWRLADENGELGADGEIGERVRLANAAKESKISQIQAAGAKYLENAAPFIKAELEYLSHRQGLIDDLAPLAADLKAIQEELIGNATLTPEDARRLDARAKELIEKIQVLIDRSKKLDDENRDNVPAQK